MKQDKETIRSYFETGDRPTQEQYHNTWDSFCHKDELITSENIEGLSQKSKSLITTSGRVLLETNFSWVTNASPSWGTNIHEYNTSAGLENQPEYSAHHLGHAIPFGYKINKVVIIGRSNALDVDDVRFQFIKRIKNTTGEWENLSSDSEFINTVLYDNFWKSNTEQNFHNSYSHRKAKRVFEMDITENKNVFEEDGEFLLYMKPSGTYTVGRQFKYSLTIEIEKVA